MKKAIYLTLLLTFLSLRAFNQSFETLNDKVVSLYNDGDYENALLYAKKALKQADTEFGEDDLRYTNSLDNIGFIYETLGYYEKALSIYQQTKQIVIKYFGKDPYLYGNCLNNLANVYNSMRQYEEALPIMIEALDNTERAFGKEHSEYGKRSSFLAGIYFNLGQYEKSLPLMLESLINSEVALGKNHPDYNKYLSDLGVLYTTLGQYEKALPLYLEALENTKINLGEKHSDYSTYLNNLASLYDEMGEYDKALPLYLQSLESIENTLGKNHSYAITLSNLATLYHIIGQYKKALSFYIEALQIIERELGKDNSNYGISLKDLASLYTTMGQYNQALPLYLEALEIIERILGKEHSSFGSTLNGLAELYMSMGQYSEALSIYQRALQITEKTLGKNHSNYFSFLNGLASLYKKMGFYEKALPIYLEVLNNIEKIFGKEHTFYVTPLNNLAGLYREIGQYENAMSLIIEALQITERLFGKDHSTYISCLKNLASLYESMGQYDNAMQLNIEALQITENIFYKGHPSYGSLINNLAGLYKSMGLYRKALPMYLESIKITEIAFGKDHPTFSVSLNNLATLYKVIGQHKEAIPLYQEALKNTESTLGKNHNSYGTYLTNLALLYEDLGQYQQAFPILKQSHQNLLSNIQRNYTFLTEKEKEQYNQTLFNNFTFFYGFTYYARHQVPEAVEQDFLIHLATSGILLNSAVDMRKLIFEHNDEALIELLHQWLATNQRLDLAVSLSQEERIQRGLDIPTIRKEAEDLERALVQQSSALAELPDYTLGKEQVAQDLKAGEAAVQFNSFTYRNSHQWTDSVLYVAYVVLPNGALHYVPLFEEAALEPLLSVFASGKKPNTSEVHTHLQQMYHLVWEPLLPFLEGIEKIYYAPSGLLSKVPFSALPHNDQQRLSEVYDLHALLSVRDLPKLKQQGEPVSDSKTLALFGGAHFDSQEPSDGEEDNDYMNDFLMNKPLSSLVSDAYRSGWAYLKGTLQEVTGIDQLAQKVGIPTMLFTGTDAGENQLKEVITEKQPAYLHIATHGYYIPPPQQKPKDNFLRIGNEKELAAPQDDPLLRSGLLLSGANAKWVHKKNIDSDNDGILTALEISRLPLNQTELVVLSACETGLGDITHSEGVMGLQRAFRMAGAKRMIVSLWEVPDQATAEMMELFYSKLFTSNLSYHEAFKQAQETLKAKYPNDIIKWAGFVLLE